VITFIGGIHIYVAILLDDSMWSFWVEANRIVLCYCFLIVICIIPFVPLVYVTFRIHLGNTEGKGPDICFHEKQKPDTFLT
jgi:hypothetical protein